MSDAAVARNIAIAIDTVVDQLSELDPAEAPEFIFVTEMAATGGHVRTQNASTGFIKQLALELLISLSLDDSVHVVAAFEHAVDELSESTASSHVSSCTVH